MCSYARVYMLCSKEVIFVFLSFMSSCRRWLQKTFDTISVALLCIFAFFLVFGSYAQVFIIKFYKWEMFGTAFDPPIPATVQPMILIIITLIAIQAVINLIVDWNKVPEVYTSEPMDKDELEAIKKSVEAK